jgi:DNA mismatch repair ATPase MutS
MHNVFLFVDQLRQKMSHLPDLERMLSRIHAGTARLNDLLNVLDAFGTAQVTNVEVFNN